jgi:tetratricopeptide (TPR) repeat protein
MGIFDRWTKKRKTSSGANPESGLTGLFQSATALREQGRYQEALALASQAADLARVRFGEAHPAYAGCLGILAEVHQDLGDHAAALPLFQRVTEIFRVAQGDADPSTSIPCTTSP